VILPVLIILFATLSAAGVAYGTHPALAQYHHGIEIILLARRLQWPLACVSLVLCIALIALVAGGRRRTWFLIGLGPMLALFAHHFAPGRSLPAVEDHPVLVAGDEAAFLRDEDYVVGFTVGDSAYAYPYAVLFSRPVIIQSDHDRRLLVIWSAYANRAVAFTIARQLHARDLELVSTPANSLLLYNTRLGEFINGVTGLTSKGTKPSGFESPVAIRKTTWAVWRNENPQSRVLAPLAVSVDAGAPAQPILPAYPMPPSNLTRPALLRVALLGEAHPVAIDSNSVGPAPMNLDVDGTPLMVFRPEAGRPMRAFDRRLPNDLRPRFDLNHAHKHGAGVFLDGDTGSSWNADGGWVDGLKSLKGRNLVRVPIEDDLYWGVMKFWFPDLTLEEGPQLK